MQVSTNMPVKQKETKLETNVHLLAGFENGSVICKRIKVATAIRKTELRQEICSILRNRYKLIVIPSPFNESELIAISPTTVNDCTLKGQEWQADIHDTGQLLILNLSDPKEQSLVAALIEKCLVVEFEQKADYWRTRSSTRYWYKSIPEKIINGIQMVSRVSLATVSLSEGRIGVVYDFGHLFQTDFTIADFFDSSVSRSEQKTRYQTFKDLTSRNEGFKGTLIYDMGKGVSNHCYFSSFAEDMTCETTGSFTINSRSFESLYDYYRKRHPQLAIDPDDTVAYVSFPGLSYQKPVAAKLLRVRVMLDKKQLPAEMRKWTVIPPHKRRSMTLNIWQQCKKAVLTNFRFDDKDELWHPGKTEHKQIACPDLQFGNMHILKAPKAVNVGEYKNYFRKRIQSIYDGGLYKYDENVAKELYIVTPGPFEGWASDLQDKFISDYTECVEKITKSKFSINIIRADSLEQIVGSLESKIPSNTVIVFDEKNIDGAAYFLLSHSLDQWIIKRLTRRTVESMWRKIHNAQNDGDKQKAERRWNDMIFHSVLDTLDQMGAVLWRLVDWPYEACLAIDVGEKRRYFAISLLVCRQSGSRPDFWRVTKSWLKGDHQHETINPEILRDKIAGLLNDYQGSTFSPLNSLLILRDGRRCGHEYQAITEGLDTWKKNGLLLQSASIDVVDVHKKTVKDLRMWSKNGYEILNVLEGHAIYLSQSTSLVCCTGMATLTKTATASPCMLVGGDNTNIKRATEAFFALSQLNYSSPGKAHRHAQPLRETDTQLQDRKARDMRGIK